jgi:hypothetical protein
MVTFVENILIAVRDWTNGKLIAVRDWTNGKLADKQDAMKRVSVANSVASQALLPNTLYVFASRTSNLTLTLLDNTGNDANEYHLFITCGSTAPTITWPDGITWNVTPIIAANKTYEVSIFNNIATCISV